MQSKLFIHAMKDKVEKTKKNVSNRRETGRVRVNEWTSARGSEENGGLGHFKLGVGMKLGMA